MEQFDDYSAMLESMLGTVESLNQLRNQAYRHYSSLISLVLRDEISSEQQVERIMDGLLDFCDEPRFLKMYKKSCRHVYCRYPQLVIDHVTLYRTLFEPAEEDNEE